MDEAPASGPYSKEIDFFAFERQNVILIFQEHDAFAGDFVGKLLARFPCLDRRLVVEAYR